MSLRFGFMALLAGLAACASVEPSVPSRPNLILIVTDDHPHDALGCAGHPILRTPHMDALASNGVRFTHGFVTTPICAASRASLFTGRYERSHGYTFGAPPLDVEAVADSYPTLLRDAGYRVGLVGKLGVRIEADDRARMFESFSPGTLPYFRGGPDADPPPRHLTERNVDRAIAFLNADDERPFCLSLSFQAPHAQDGHPNQYHWAPNQDGRYDDVQIPPPVTGEPAFFDALPEFLQTGLNRERWFWRFDTTDKYERMVRGYYRMIGGVDDGIGRVMAALEETGQIKNTVVLLIGDNGYFLGERGYAGKWTMHDRSTRVPFLVLDPRGANPGHVNDAFVTNLDIAPTLLEWAGVHAPEAMQGRSLVALLGGESTGWRRQVFTEHLWDHDRIPRTEGLRTREWKYVRYLDHPTFEELYDLTNDPHEARNLASDPDRAKVLREMKELCSHAARRAE